MTDLFAKYPPPPYPAAAAPPAGMGVQGFALIPAGLKGGQFCACSVFGELDAQDAAAVLAERVRYSSWLRDERAMNAPFVAIARGSVS